MDLKTQGRWEQVKGRVKETWAMLTDDDIDRTEGRFDRLVGLIKEKTGETTDAVESRVRDILEEI